MRKRLLLGAATAATVLSAAAALHPVDAPDLPTLGVTDRSSCHHDDPAAPFGTYVRADNETTLLTAADAAIMVTADATGSTHDCGPAGRGTAVHELTIRLEFLLQGTDVCHPETADRRPATELSEECSTRRDELRVTRETSCHGEATCRISVANKTFRAQPGGHIARLETRSVARSGGPGGPVAMKHQVLPNSR